MPEPGCFLRHRMRCNAEFYYVGKIPRICIGCPSLQRYVVLKWFYSSRAMGRTLSEVNALHRVPTETEIKLVVSGGVDCTADRHESSRGLFATARGARRMFCRGVQPMAHSSNFLVTVHIKEKNWCSHNPSVENNLASSLFNCNVIRSSLRS